MNKDNNFYPSVELLACPSIGFFILQFVYNVDTQLYNKQKIGCVGMEIAGDRRQKTASLQEYFLF